MLIFVTYNNHAQVNIIKPHLSLFQMQQTSRHRTDSKSVLAIGVTKKGFNFLPETTEVRTKYIKQWWAYGQWSLRDRRQTKWPLSLLQRSAWREFPHWGAGKGNPEGASRQSELRKLNWDLRRTRWIDLWDRKSRSRVLCKENVAAERFPWVFNWVLFGYVCNWLPKAQETIIWTD